MPQTTDKPGVLTVRADWLTEDGHRYVIVARAANDDPGPIDAWLAIVADLRKLAPH